MRYEPPIDLMPGWRRALRWFEQGGFKPGDFVSHEALDVELGLVRSTSGSYDDFKRFELHELRETSEFRQRVLDQHQLALQREEGGFRVLTASEQLRLANDEGSRRMRSAAKWTASMLLNTDVAALSDGERAQHAESLARIARLRSMARTPRALPAPKEST